MRGSKNVDLGSGSVGELLFSLGMSPVNTLLFLMLFPAVVLPICLALGSRFGKWLAGHLDF